MENEYLLRLREILDKDDFSMELINRCRYQFQALGGPIREYTTERFKKMFEHKVIESGISFRLTDEQIDQIIKIITWGGGVRLKDIYFIGNAAFDVIITNNGTHILYHYTSDKYVSRGFDDIEHAIYYACLHGIDTSVLLQLDEEIKNISMTYYRTFNPEKLSLSSNGLVDFIAIGRDEVEAINGLISKTPFDISVICAQEGTLNLVKLDITCDLSKEKFLTVTNVDENVIKLSSIIKEHNKDKRKSLSINNK